MRVFFTWTCTRVCVFVRAQYCVCVVCSHVSMCVPCVFGVCSHVCLVCSHVSMCVPCVCVCVCVCVCLCVCRCTCATWMNVSTWEMCARADPRHGTAAPCESSGVLEGGVRERDMTGVDGGGCLRRGLVFLASALSWTLLSFSPRLCSPLSPSLCSLSLLDSAIS